MNRRGFAGMALATIGGLFLQRKTGGELETLKVGDAVRVNVPPMSHATKFGLFYSVAYAETGYVSFLNSQKIEINNGLGISTYASHGDSTGLWYPNVDNKSVLVKIEKIPIQEV